MTGVFSGSPRIPHVLRRGAPPSVVERGIELASTGSVIECSRSGQRISGSIREDSGETFSASISSGGEEIFDVTCTCASKEDLSEQWCKHIVALAARANDLGFFDQSAGFDSSRTESGASLSESVSRVIRSLSHVDDNQALPPTPLKINLYLEKSGIGIELYRGTHQLDPQSIVIKSHEDSNEAIDMVLFETLERDSDWLEGRWIISNGSIITRLLGIVSTYKDVYEGVSGKPLQIESDTLSSHIELVWSASELRISISYLLANGKSIIPTTPVLGERVMWIGAQSSKSHHLYRIDERTVPLANLFRRHASHAIPLKQTGPILEVLDDTSLTSYVKVINPTLQPLGKIVTPTPQLRLELRENQFEHFASNTRIEIIGELTFEYPEATAPKLVHLPDRTFEAACRTSLLSKGFLFSEDRGRFIIASEAALDFLFTGHSSLPESWSISGLEEMRQKIRFTQLKLSVRLRSSENDKFDCEVSLMQGRSPLELRSFFKLAQQEAEKWVRLENGQYARVPGGSLLHLKTTLGLLDPTFRLKTTIRATLASPQAIALSTLEGDAIQMDLDAGARELANRLRTFSGIEAKKPSRKFHGKLRHYQEDGVGWLSFLHHYKFGGILADEMGLGKTVQALAFIQSLHDEAKKNGIKMKPVLIVTPTSVTTNWLHEAKRFTPSLSTLLLQGPKRKSQFTSIPTKDLVITSFALLRFDRLELERHDFSYVILDEAQLIKNPVASTTKAAKSLKSDYRIALTGTPTENRPLELWSIFDFVMPGYLGSSEFFKNNIERAVLDPKDESGITQLLNQRTKPFILRRLKSEVEKELPPKVESPLYVSMTPSQARLYDEVLADVKPRVLESASKKGIGASTVSILAALLRLRQVCNHPNSLPSLLDATGYDSGKFSLFQELVLEALSNKRKILVYSQFLDMLAIMRRWLDEEKVSYLYLDGSTNDRQTIVDQFNSDESVRVFLISLKAGGMGLNLTAADTVIIYDPWWNPAVEAQAVDRAHRIGQTKAISVYRLITENSIEERILALKAKKSKLIDSLITDNRMSSLELTMGDLEKLFSGSST